MVAFSLQYCSTNLLLTSVASPGLGWCECVGGWGMGEICMARHSSRHSHVCLMSPLVPVEGGDQNDTPPIGWEGGRIALHLSKLGGRQLSKTCQPEVETL